MSNIFTVLFGGAQETERRIRNEKMYSVRGGNIVVNPNRLAESLRGKEKTEDVNSSSEDTATDE